jgi:hypothetical protein
MEMAMEMGRHPHRTAPGGGEGSLFTPRAKGPEAELLAAQESEESAESMVIQLYSLLQARRPPPL